MSEIRVEQRGAATVITIDRAHVKNALDARAVAALHRVLDEQRGILVLTGAGDAFVSGADIAELAARERLDALARINGALFRRLELHPAPVIAAINGHALGGGLELALACDIRVAAKHARLGQPEVSLGIIPAAGATYRLPRIIGLGRAKELVLGARIITADEALQIGLVSAVGDDAMSLALVQAERLGKHSPLALRLAKTAFESAYAPLEAAMGVESLAQAVLFEDDEKRARMQAFLNKGET